MESDDFDAFFGQVRHIGQVFGTVYKDLTGEDFNLESAVRHYPLLALGLGAGAGALAGFWCGHRSRPQLPPPAPERLAPHEHARSPFSYLEEAFPEAVDKVRDALPEIIVSDAVKARARTWMGNIVDSQIRQNVDTFTDSLDARIATFFRGAMQRLEPEEDVHLDDPDAPE